jgi:hypothetical protein
MKALFVTFSIFLCSIALKANHTYSQLRLKMFDNSAFTVLFNNQKYATPVSNFNIKGISPGRHKIKVFKARYGYMNHQPILVYNGWINIPARTKVVAIIDAYHQFNILNQISICDGTPDFNYYGNNGFDAANSTCSAPYYEALPSAPCMSHGSFKQLLATMENSSFDSNKLQIAMQAISRSGISSDQVLTLLNEMTFESNKLALAKQAYKHTFDKENYFIVNNGFTFSSSIHTLNEYINRF